jgi:methionine-rich copper-binding protein CopC
MRLHINPNDSTVKKMFRLLSCIFALAFLSSCSSSTEMAHDSSQCAQPVAEQQMTPAPQPYAMDAQQAASIAPAANTPVMLPFPTQPVVQTPFSQATPAPAPVEPQRSFIPAKKTAAKTDDSWLHL